MDSFGHLKYNTIFEIRCQFHQHFTKTFTGGDPKSAKKNDSLTVFLAHLESASVKASTKMLGKLTPGVNFINILRTSFTLVDPKSVKKHS